MSVLAAHRAESDGGRAESAQHGLSSRRLPLLAVAWLLGVALVAFALTMNHGAHGQDGHAYWLTAHHDGNKYVLPAGSIYAYLYSPAFSTAIWPLAHMSWGVFVTVWALAEAAVFAWLLWPLPLEWRIPAFCACSVEIMLGNVWAFYALVAVLGLRRPGLWALPLLTKISPGIVGLVWFAVRREWRAFGVALAWTAGIALVSIAIAPHQWVDWVRFLRDAPTSSQLLLPVRFAAAVVLTVLAARRGWTWLLLVAMMLAVPQVHSLAALTMLAALPRVLNREPQSTMPQPRQPSFVQTST